MKPYGLVLAGGGGKGAYEIGAWKAMREIGVTFSAVAGTSIGSINGAFIAADNYDGALTLWQNVTVGKGINITEELKDPNNLFSAKNIPVLVKEFFKNGGIDASPTKEYLSRYLSERSVRESDIKFGMVTFHLSGFNPIEVFIDGIPEGELIDYLLASSKFPGVSNIGPEGEAYLDGGVYDNAPIEFLRKNGYNRLVVVDISSIKGVGHSSDISCSEVVYIRPYDLDELGAAFDFDVELNEKRILLGYYDTRKAFGFLSGRIYYFDGDGFMDMVKHYGSDACAQLEEFALALDLPKLTVYTENEFLLALKRQYLDREEQEKAEEENETPRFYDGLLKRLAALKPGKDYSLAVAVLDGLVI